MTTRNGRHTASADGLAEVRRRHGRAAGDSARQARAELEARSEAAAYEAGPPAPLPAHKQRARDLRDSRRRHGLDD